MVIIWAMAKKNSQSDLAGQNRLRRRKRAVSASKNTVGLLPKGNWHKRNFLTEVLIPSIFSKRKGAKQRPEFAEIEPGSVCITWIGHASFLLRTAHGNILIDPNWANWLKVVKRLKHPGLCIHNLPEIDLVLITHAHFDHLDRNSLRKIASHQPIVVPAGVGNLVHDLGFRDVHELDEWEELTLGNLHLTLTPCAHWGARVLHDSHRGYGGYLIEFDGRSVYHCGDSAYFDGFREIGQRKDIEIALLPIGAYDPPSGREVHMNPEEAMQTFIDLQARLLIPMHYGSFRLSYEPLHEPLDRLQQAAKKYDQFEYLNILTEGEPQVL